MMAASRKNILRTPEVWHFGQVSVANLDIYIWNTYKPAAGLRGSACAALRGRRNGFQAKGMRLMARRVYGALAAVFAIAAVVAVAQVFSSSGATKRPFFHVSKQARAESSEATPGEGPAG